MTQRWLLIYIVVAIAWLVFRLITIVEGNASVEWTVVLPLIGLCAATIVYVREELR